MKRITLTRLTILLSFCAATVAYAAQPPPDPDSMPWKIAAALASTLLATFGTIAWKMDKNQTLLFSLYGISKDDISRIELANKIEIGRLELKVVEIETGIEYCDACNSHRHRRQGDPKE